MERRADQKIQRSSTGLAPTGTRERGLAGARPVDGLVGNTGLARARQVSGGAYTGKIAVEPEPRTRNSAGRHSWKQQ